MKLSITLIACLALLFAACSYRPALASKDQVCFVRFYTEYGLTSYSVDSVKLPKPLQTWLGVYYVEYELNSSSLTVRKRELGTYGAQTVLSTQMLSRADKRLVTQRLAAIQPAQLARYIDGCEENPVDDGFTLTTTLTKVGNSTKFAWSGCYDTRLVDLLDVVNELAPSKYRFYKSGQQEAFKQAVLHVHNAP